MGDESPRPRADIRREPGVAVVLCSRDRPRFLQAALEALRRALRSQDEVIVVDSASRDGGTRRVAESAGFPVVRCERPGLSRARNAGLRATQAPLVAFTDDDCLAQPGWTAAIEKGFDDPEVGCVLGRILAEGSDGPAITIATDTRRRYFDGGHDPATMGGHGANMAFRRAAVEVAHGFDEMLGAGGPLRSAEDHDLIWRVLRLGWRTLYEPEAVVKHRQWRTQNQLWATKFRYGMGSGAFAVKLVRLEGAPGQAMLRDWLWRRSMLRAAVLLREGSGLGAIGNLAQFAGVVIGAFRGWSLPLRDGLYESRANGSSSLPRTEE